MGRLAQGIVNRRKLILVLFLVLSVLSVFAMGLVGINYNLVDYLPKQAESTIALDTMEAEFDQATPNANVMVQDVSVTQALEYKDKIAAVKGVSAVTWLDDMTDIYQPLETMTAGLAEEYYRNGTALFSVAVEEGAESTACADIREIIGDENAMSGEAVRTSAMRATTGSEVANAMLILIPVILLILILSTSSWLEPVLFIGAIGVSVVINMGTNFIFGEISFMTNSIAPILQLAVSLDYAIFLLHSFEGYRKDYIDDKVAMQHAIKASMKTVAASATTTLFGFLALIFMDFKIGADMGLSLAKGIILSFLSVVVFLPALTLALVKGLDKTRHRPFMPSFQGVGKVLMKLAVPALIIVAVVILPCFLGQGRTSFLYGSGTADESTQLGLDQMAIEEQFGQSTSMVVLVPRGDVVKELELSEELAGLESVRSVISYASTVGTVIPAEYLDSSIVKQFYSENYARIILGLDTPQEGSKAFAAVQEIRDITKEYYGSEAYTLGESANLYDMKNTVQADNTRVNMIAIIAIFLVLLLSFKSLTLPLILLLTIEAAIWINMAVPYFMGTSINFIGYLVVSTVQLGATVDYAILLTDHYMNNRRLLPKKESVLWALGESFKSILVSASTLSVAGFALYLSSSDNSVRDIGLLLGRGTLISMVMVLCFLPALLWLLDGATKKLTWKTDFHKPDKAKKHRKSTREEGQS